MKGETYDQKLGGEDRIETRKRGVWLLNNPSTNKGLAYTKEERRQLGLDGLLPDQVLQIEQQVELVSLDLEQGRWQVLHVYKRDMGCCQER